MGEQISSVPLLHYIFLSGSFLCPTLSFSQDICFLVITGKSWQEKVIDVRLVMKEKAATALIVTALDEVACKYSIVEIFFSCDFGCGCS